VGQVDVTLLEGNITCLAVSQAVVVLLGEADFVLARLQFDDERLWRRLGRLVAQHREPGGRLRLVGGGHDLAVRFRLQHARDEILLLDLGARLVVGAGLQQVHADVGAHAAQRVTPVAADGAAETLQHAGVVLLEVLLGGRGRRQVRAAARAPPPARRQQTCHWR